MDLAREVLDLVEAESVVQTSRDEPVVRFLQPAQLKDELRLGLSEQGDPSAAMAALRGVAKWSVRTNHPAFVNQLYGGLDYYGLAGELLATALNTNQYTYEVAPVLTLCEMEVVNRIISLMGFTRGDGLFTPERRKIIQVCYIHGTTVVGTLLLMIRNVSRSNLQFSCSWDVFNDFYFISGSISNMYGMVLARYKKFPDVKTKGLFSLPPYVIFTSQDSHYSITKGSHWLGIGTENVCKVKTDSHGRMIPEELEAAINSCVDSGKVPFFVNATAGTTVVGAFDPLDRIADICQKYNIWLHVDACWGGSVIFSKRHSHLLHGIERVDSLSWNPHKMLGAPLQCSLFLTKEKDLLKDANCAGAKYLFQQDKMYDVSYDSGDKSLQCGRKTDALKVWTMWRARGDEGFGSLVDQTFSLARYFLEQIRHREGYKLVMDDFECTNICFWYIPARLRNQKETEQWWSEVYTVAPRLKERLVKCGKAMIGYQPLSHKNLGNFFRFVLTAHPARDKDFIDNLIQTIDTCGKDL